LDCAVKTNAPSGSPPRVSPFKRGVSFEARVVERAGAGKGESKLPGCSRILLAQGFDLGEIDARAFGVHLELVGF
jgi:hypothetical protein